MTITERIDGYLMKAWVRVVELHLLFFSTRALEPERDRTGHITILNSHEEPILELESAPTRPLVGC